MAIEDIKQLKTVNHQGPAEQALREGWVLLAVCVKQDGNDQYAEYHLGKPAPEVDPNNPTRQQFIAAGAFGAEKKD